MHPYESYVAAQCRKNPCLANLERFLANCPQRNTCRIARFGFQCDDEKKVHLRYQLLSPDDLISAIHSSEGSFRGQILVVEDLSRDIINTLGSTLQIDPLFFASHLDASSRSISAQTPNLATLPSRTRRQSYVSVQYHRALELPPGQFRPESKLLRATNVCRKVAVLPPIRNVCVGLVQHCCSIHFINKAKKGDCWLCLILVDPPISQSRIEIAANENELTNGVTRGIDIKHFLRGYEDFLDPVPMPSKLPQSRLPSLAREGILEDLHYFWTRKWPASFDSTNPTLLAFCEHPLKIIAAEWVNYLAIMSYLLKEYEYGIIGHQVELQDLEDLNTDLDSLQTWRRRSLSSQQKIAAVKLFVEYQTRNGDEKCHADAEDLLLDFDYITENIQRYSERVESMLLVVTSLVQISDSRRSLLEAANVGRLTLLAFIFVPLSFTTSLFSMNSELPPGGRIFWIWVVVAVCLSSIVGIIARPPKILLRFVSARFGSLQTRTSPV